MHVIICGGRDIDLTPEDFRWLTRLRIAHGITTVFHGAARGVDTAAKHWAIREGLAVRAFHAHWQQEGPAAGPRRNARMLAALVEEAGEAPCAVIAFPGGKGTADCVGQARRLGVPVFTQQSYEEEEPDA